MENRYHSLIIGAGIAGMESALNLANQGYRVLLVEKGPSIGGNMIALSKVFPTLDCSSCITTPKMSEVAHHDNIDILTHAQVRRIERRGKSFEIRVEKKPRYVNELTCTGCKSCEEACPVYVPHEFDRGLGARKAIYIPFTTAIPQIALLDPDNCIRCGRCYSVCPTQPKSVDYLQETEEIPIEAKSVVFATGYKLTAVDRKQEYSDGSHLNVITSFQLERILAPNGPYGGVLRPSDGKEPENVAFVLCAGSRDKSIGIPYCSRVCCMYSIKQAMLLSGALPLADLTLYYMDIRAFGKGYEQFYQNAKAMGINFAKAKVARIEAAGGGDLNVRIEALEDRGEPRTVQHDLVVLACGILPGFSPRELVPVDVDRYGFIESSRPKDDPMLTNVEGVFFAGVSGGPKDIVDTIMEAGSAAMKCSLYVDAISREEPNA